MNYEYLTIEDTKKLANYDKVVAERERYKSDWSIVSQKLKEVEKNYLKIIEEKNKEIKNLKERLSKLESKQIDIYEEIKKIIDNHTYTQKDDYYDYCEQGISIVDIDDDYDRLNNLLQKYKGDNK